MIKVWIDLKMSQENLRSCSIHHSSRGIWRKRQYRRQIFLQVQFIPDLQPTPQIACGRISCSTCCIMRHNSTARSGKRVCDLQTTFHNWPNRMSESCKKDKECPNPSLNRITGPVSYVLLYANVGTSLSPTQTQDTSWWWLISCWNDRTGQLSRGSCNHEVGSSRLVKWDMTR